MESPSKVAVPRPISSRMTSARRPAWFRIAAVSTISTMKVERPRARSSAAPTRLKTASTTPISAARAGTKLPACASIAISAFCRKKVDFPAMFGPVRSQMRPGFRFPSAWTPDGRGRHVSPHPEVRSPACRASLEGPRSQSFPTKLCPPRLSACFDHRVAPAVDGEGEALRRPSAAHSSRRPQARPAPPPRRSRQAPARRRGSPSPRARRCAARSSKTPSSIASARSAALAIFCSSSASSVVVKRMALAMRLAVDELVRAAVRLQRGRLSGGHLDEIAEHVVVPDLQRADAGLAGVARLQAGDDPAALVAQRPRLVERRCEAARTNPPSRFRSGSASESAAASARRAAAGRSPRRTAEPGAPGGRVTDFATSSSAACGESPARPPARRGPCRDRAGRRAPARAATAPSACPGRRRKRRCGYPPSAPAARRKTATRSRRSVDRSRVGERTCQALRQEPRARRGPRAVDRRDERSRRARRRWSGRAPDWRASPHRCASSRRRGAACGGAIGGRLAICVFST